MNSWAYADSGAKSRRRAFLIGCALAGAATLLFLFWVLFTLGGARVSDGVDDVGEFVAALFAAVVCVVAARRSESGRAGWAFMAAASGSWALGEAVWTYYDLIKAVQVPFPSLADLGFLSAVPLMCAGLCLFPTFSPRVTHRVEGLLDGCIIALALLFASWATILGPMYRSNHGSLLKDVLSLAYPVGDVIMLSLVIILIARTGQHTRLRLSLVMMGIVAFAVADSSFAYLTQTNQYGNGTVLDTGWVAGFVLIGLGALRAVTHRSEMKEREGVSTVSLLAPYVPVLVVLGVTAVQILRGRHIDRISWFMVLALVVLVLGRELFRLWDQNIVSRMFDGADVPDERFEITRSPEEGVVIVSR